MIVRTEGEYLVLITQPDHARLAGTIAAAWRRGDFFGPHRSSLLLATHEHDNGWSEPDTAPEIDPSTGRPFDFISAPAEVKQAVWPRGVSRLERSDPLAAAYVAQHALTVLDNYQTTASWQPFFEQMMRSRDLLLERCHLGKPDDRAAFSREYQLLYLSDFLSLAFCNGWAQTFDAADYRFGMEPHDQLSVAPDPFDGEVVELIVSARRILNRPYRSAAELRQCLAAAKPITVRGCAVGVR